MVTGESYRHIKCNIFRERCEHLDYRVLSAVELECFLVVILSRNVEMMRAGAKIIQLALRDARQITR